MLVPNVVHEAAGPAGKVIVQDIEVGVPILILE